METNLWLMETILCQYLEYPFHWKRFFHLLEIYFKRIHYYSQWQRISFLAETIFFHSLFFFLETIIASRGRPTFLNILFLLEETVFFFFLALIRMEVAFRSSEIAFFRKSFVLAIGNGFLINYKLYALIRSFSLLVDTIYEIRCKPIFFHLLYS